MVKELARHCDIRMTSNYTNVGLDDQHSAVNQLPKIELSRIDPAESCLHIVCTDGGSEGQSGASSVTHWHQVNGAQKRKNPCKNKGLVADCQPVAPSGTNRQKVEAAGIECE